MIRHIRSNLIAYLALFLALSSGSFAIAALNRHDKRVIKKIVNKQITRRAHGLSVNQANTANEATHAGNASQLGGSPPSRYLDACPAGMTLVGVAHDLCVDSSDRATNKNWSDSAEVCRHAGLRQPSVGEALEAGDFIDASAGAGHFYWTTHIWNDVGQSPQEQGLAYYTGSSGGIGSYNRSNGFWVRCVATPTTG